ncbi:hypothetical protein ACN42_g2577 [Penicillium freii]|uniref:Secreted protein n=1 Tax=Penicillium freii TaxID=48697 RepID=A0A101MPS3_PENFR|nr:hypothetical protein ACN42_g2577 [Penicillium freii]
MHSWGWGPLLTLALVHGSNGMIHLQIITQSYNHQRFKLRITKYRSQLRADARRQMREQDRWTLGEQLELSKENCLE